ncbi:MAG: TIGR03032 family protein [Sulfurimonas sp.]|nr:TIGR03032 family protein [Sulfurimonas sp.]
MNPFQARYTPNFPELLNKLGGTIMLTTYQTGKVIMLSSDAKNISQLVRDFDRPMGVAFSGDRMAMALRTNITFFKDSKELASSYPTKPNTYDALYYPIAQNITGYIDAHDVVFSNQGLIAVNTSYSCLVKFDGTNSFEPLWKPPFIKKLASGDACHLNGVCVDENQNIRYVTAFGQTTEPGGWRMNKLTGGFLYDIQEEKFLAQNLPMPHSPRLYKNELYVLLSATEELIKVNRTTGEQEKIIKVDGFIRGLSFFENYAFIGVSKLRKSHTFGDLPIARKKLHAGVVVIDLNTKEKVAEIFYEDKLEEIYDVHFIPNAKKVNIMNQSLTAQNPAIITPQFSHWITKKEDQTKSNKENKDEL